MTETDWQLQEAKARLSELVKSAQHKGPQQITVHGKPAAVVLSRGDYDRLTNEKPWVILIFPVWMSLILGRYNGAQRS